VARAPIGRGGGATITTASKATGVALLEQRLKTILDGLGGTYSIEIALPNTRRAPPKLVRGGYSKARQATLSEVFGWFVHGTTRGQPARNVLQLTPGMVRSLLDTVEQRYYERSREGDVPTLSQLMPGIAFAWRDLIVKRLEAGGGDLTLAPLSASHRARKLRLGYPAKVGTMTGQTLIALRKAQPIIRKKR